MTPFVQPPATAVVADPTQTPSTNAPRTAAMQTTGRNGVTVLRDEKGRLLPGQTPNPLGRQKGLSARVREMVDFDKAIETLVDIAWGKLAPASRVADRIKAIELLMDRGFGKPQQTVDIKETAGAAVMVAKGMSTEKLIATVEAMRRLAEGTPQDEGH